MIRNKSYPVIENIEITDIAAEGNAIAHVDGKVLFVPKAIPGDIVDVQIRRKRKSYMEGTIVALKKKSDQRVNPFCAHFGTCGGCTWQHLPYAEQLRYKQKQVIDNFQRIGKTEIGEIIPILPSEKTMYYRNKLEYTFSNKRWLTEEEIATGAIIDPQPALGFHIPGMFDKVFPVEECFHQPDPSNQIRLTVKDYAIENNLDFFDIRGKKGFLRTLIIRDTANGEVMVILAMFYEDKEKREKLLDYLKNKFPSLTSLQYVINPKLNDTLTDLKIITYFGRDYIMEEMEDLKFRIGAKSFYQTNSHQAYRLYCIARDFAGLKANDIAYDLYTGTGTIANFLARQCKKVIGIEYVPEAIDDAKINSQINNINNTLFFAGDMKDVLTESFVNQYGHPDVLILDPPRSGVHEKVIDTIKYANPDRLVYISCNTATQARDINLLSSVYKVSRVQPVDMFPHTFHVENVALLEKK